MDINFKVVDSSHTEVDYVMDLNMSFNEIGALSFYHHINSKINLDANDELILNEFSSKINRAESYVNWGKDYICVYNLEGDTVESLVYKTPKEFVSRKKMGNIESYYIMSTIDDVVDYVKTIIR